MNSTYTQILPGTSSFQLVRTNPLLTGNVKITVDSEQNVWLNSINANAELAKDQYKRFPVDVTIGHDTNLFSFFNNGDTTPDIVFDLEEKINISTTSTKFEDQFDFSNYFSGVRYSTDRRYTERFSMFAPIYLKQDLPNYYVVFKILGAMQGNVSQSQANYPINKNDYIRELLSEAQIVATFDLTNQTKIGTYLRKIINDPNFPESPITINFEEGRFSSFNGISYRAGIFTEANENLYDYLQTGNPIRAFEEYISLGFQRNGIIFPNIVNLEFMFDDPSATVYDFNRYVGFYCNTIELDSAILDTASHFNLHLNTPTLPTRYLPSEDISFDQTNATGIEFYFKQASRGPNSINNAFSSDSEIFFNYIQGRDSGIHLIKPGSIEYLTETSGKMVLSSTEIDIGTLFGPDSVFLEDTSTVFYGQSQSHIDAEVIYPFKTEDYIKFYHPLGTRKDNHGKYDRFFAVEYHSAIPNPGDYYVSHNQHHAGDTFYFNCTGNPIQITTAIVGCINSILYAPFSAIQFGNRFWVIMSSPGNYDLQYGLLYHSFDGSTWDSIQINKQTGYSGLHNNVINLVGGDNFNYHLNLSSGHKPKIDAMFRNVDEQPVYDLLLDTNKNWVPVVKTSYDIQYITADALSDPLFGQTAVSNYDNNMSVFLEESAQPITPNTLAQIKSQFYFRIGVLSFLDIMDFDYDLYSSTYTRFQEMDLYKDFFVPAGIDALDLDNYEYVVYGTGTISINGTEYSSGDAIYGTGLQSYVVLGGDPIVVKYNVTQDGDIRLDIPLWDSNGELQQFTGFSTIHYQTAQVIDQSIEYLYRDKYITQANTEYDVLNEANTKDFSSKSLIIPYICKWGYVDGTDVRDNAYRLNNEFVFGEDNFSPNHSETTANPSRFTHEWFYIESNFGYIDDPSLMSDNHYYFDSPLDLTSVLTDPNAFLDYFAYAPTYSGKQIGRTQHRYAFTEFESGTQLYETLFKGFRMQFKEISSTPGIGTDGKPNYVINSQRFEGYKFTSFLRVIPENICSDNQQPVRFRFIEHKDFKFVILLIEVVLNNKTVLSPNLLVDSPTSPFDINHTQITLDNFYNVNPYDSFLPYFYGIFGDYRIDLNWNGTTDLTYAFLYYAKNKKYNTLIDSFSNIKLTRKIDFSVSGVYEDLLTDTFYIKSLQNPNLPNWPAQLEDEIRSTDISSLIYVRLPGSTPNSVPCFSYDFVLSGRNGPFSFADSMLGSVNKNDLGLVTTYFDEVTSLSQNVNTSSFDLAFPVKPPVGPYYGVALTTAYYMPALVQSTWLGSMFFQLMGGEDYYDSLFSNLTFSKFKTNVNNLAKVIEYESWSLNSSGVSVETSDQEFYVEIETPVSLVKTSFPSSIPELIDVVTSVPKVVNKIQQKSLNANPRIAGYQFMRNQIAGTSTLNRYNGGYEPLFKPVVSYVKDFIVTFNQPNTSPGDSEVITLGNVLINVNDADLFDINNFNHIKVSPSSILTLENDPRYTTVYPLIGETPIGKASMFLLNSSWDWGFHYQYSDKFFYVPVSGTLRIGEESNFLGKVMVLPESIELDIFTATQVTTDVNSIDITNYPLIWQETDTDIRGRINVGLILTQYLQQSGVTQTFNNIFVDTDGNILTSNSNFLGNITLSDYIQQYIETNFLPLYTISTAQFFTRPNRALTSTNTNVGSNVNTINFVFLADDTIRQAEGFSLAAGILINNSGTLELDFTIPKSLGFSLDISPKIIINLL